MGPNTGSPPPGVCPEGIFVCGDSPASRTAQSSSGSARRHPDTCAHRRMAVQAVRRAALPARIALRGSRAALRIAAWNLSMCRPPSFAVVYAPRRFFMRAWGLPCGGFAPCIPGAEPGRHLQPQQKRYSAGGLPSLPPADPAFPEAAGGLGGFGRLPALPLALFLAPHPPAPLPLRGRGRLKVYFAGGFAPGTPALDRLRHL